MMKILIIQTASLGDVILATATANSIKELFPDCEKDGNCPVDDADYKIPTNCEKRKLSMIVHTVKEQMDIIIAPAKKEDDLVFLHIMTDSDIQNRQNLVMLEKNMTISTLASGIAHEFNNMNAEVKALIETTDSQIRGVSKAYIALDGTDYNLFSKEEKMQAGLLVNSSLTLAQLIDKELKLDA